MRPQHLVTFPRILHPGAWWLWAVALAAAASRTQNPVPLALILVVTGFVVMARRSNAPWSRSYVAFLKLSLVIIAVRILFQALLSTGAQGPTVLVELPSLPMPAGSGLKLGGVVSLEAVLRAFYEGLQLATILCCVGAANALGSARRLLRYVPGALYEIGVACVIALTFAPQLVVDAATRPGGAPAPRPADLRPRRPAPARDAGARGRPGAIGRPGRSDGLPRLRAYDG